MTVFGNRGDRFTPARSEVRSEDQSDDVRRWPRAWRRLTTRISSRSGQRDLLRLALVLAALAGVWGAIKGLGLRLQHTGSLPLGVYRDINDTPLVRGAVGVWCLPRETARWAVARGYLGRGRCVGGAEPLGKVVLAVTGDSVALTAQGLTFNSRAVPNSAPILNDSHGRRITPAPYGMYVIGPGKVWLWSPYTSRSFDSRYFGPVPITALISLVRPVWTTSLPVSQPSPSPGDAVTQP